MRALRYLVILAAIAGMAAVAVSQQSSTAMRILSPVNGAQTDNSFVNVRYQLQPAADAASTPTFQLQLDSGDPVRTADTQYTFTGLAPGNHTVTVEAVDANSRPIPGTRTQVQFTVVGPGAPSSGRLTHSRLVNTSMQSDNGAQAAAPGAPQGQLPQTGSGLPLLSVIGMGVLIGGIASALRTRHSDSR